MWRERKKREKQIYELFFFLRERTHSHSKEIKSGSSYNHRASSKVTVAKATQSQVPTANQSTQSKHIHYPMTKQQFKQSNLRQADAISCTRSVIFMTFRGKNLLIRNSSSLTVKLGYTFIHDIEVWINHPPQPGSQGNIHIHDTGQDQKASN